MPLSKRVRVAAAKRAAVMSSAAFQDWWASRRHIHPVPSDPYRAFMIDRGIPAQIVEHEIWEPRTNRTDVIPVDIVKGQRHNRPREHHHYRLDYLPYAARPIGKHTPEEQELEAHVTKMAEKYHVPVPQIIFERGEGEMSSAYFQVSDYRNFSKPFIKIGVRGLNKKTLPKHKAVIGHEMGHHVHHTGADALLTGMNIRGALGAPRAEKERAAWAIADPFMTDQRAVQKWAKKFALGTYLGTSGHGKRGVDWGRNGVAAAILGSPPKRKKRR